MTDDDVVDIRWARRRRRNRERRQFNRMVGDLTEGWYAICPTHGKQPVDPFNDAVLVCGCTKP